MAVHRTAVSVHEIPRHCNRSAMDLYRRSGTFTGFRDPTIGLNGTNSRGQCHGNESFHHGIFIEIIRGKDVRPLRAVSCGLPMHCQFRAMTLPWLPHHNATAMAWQGHGNTMALPRQRQVL